MKRPNYGHEETLGGDDMELESPTEESHAENFPRSDQLYRRRGQRRFRLPCESNIGALKKAGLDNFKGSAAEFEEQYAKFLRCPPERKKYRRRNYRPPWFNPKHKPQTIKVVDYSHRHIDFGGTTVPPKEESHSLNPVPSSLATSSLATTLNELIKVAKSSSDVESLELGRIVLNLDPKLVAEAVDGFKRIAGELSPPQVCFVCALCR